MTLEEEMAVREAAHAQRIDAFEKRAVELAGLEGCDPLIARYIVRLEARIQQLECPPARIGDFGKKVVP
jgi:hypothetical protein